MNNREMSLGGALLKARKAACMTLQEAADRANTSKSYVWAIENNRSIPSFGLVVRLANAYYVSVEELAKCRLPVKSNEA